MNLTRLVTWAAIALLYSAPSLAALHSQDDAVFGPDSVTYDDTTGLEWLDLTASKGLSYDQIITQFGPGGAFEGWRHATTMEAKELAIHAGVTINIGSTTANYLPASKLLGLVGVTVISGIGTQALGFVAEPGTGPGLRRVFSVATQDGITGSSGPAFEDYDNVGDAAIAHYLVRNTADSVHTFRFEGRLQSGQLLEIAYSFVPSSAQVTGSTSGTIYSHLMQGATIKIDGVAAPATLRPDASIIYIQNNLQADQNYDRYQAILEFASTVNAAGLSFNRIYIYGEDPTPAPAFSTVLRNENLVLDSGLLYRFPILQAMFQDNSGAPANPRPDIAPVALDYKEAIGGDLPTNFPLHRFQLGVGVNKISGSEFLDPSGEFDADHLAFTVPTGGVLESIQYEYSYATEPGAILWEEGFELWRGDFVQSFGGDPVTFLFTQNPSSQDTSPVNLFGSVLPRGFGDYILAHSNFGTEPDRTGTRSVNYTVRFIVRSNAATDATPPVIEPVVLGLQAGLEGWYRDDVELYWNVTDGGSVISTQTGCKAVAQTTDNTGDTYTCSADSGGGTTTSSFTLKRDATRPVISVTTAPLPNAFGWNNTPVTASWSAVDPMPGSGVASCMPDHVFAEEGDHQNWLASCTDVAGNPNRKSANVRIDMTAPIINLISPQNGASYAIGTIVGAEYDCADELSGVLNCDGPIGNGSNIDTATLGVKSFTVTSVDLAGNVDTQVSSYTVTDPPLPVYTLSGNALDFGNQPGGVATDPLYITVTNTGLVPLPITSVTRTGTNANQFSQTNDCGTSVPVNSSCTVAVVFLPTSAGTKVATLNVNAGGSAGRKTVSLAGNGLVASYDLAPAALAFGIQARSVASDAQVLSLTNTSDVPLAITSITRTGTNANQFSQTNNCPAVLALQASCSITVVFLPTSVGDKAATLNVNAAGGAGTRSVSLTGTGAVPAFTLSPNPLVFATQTIGDPVSGSIVTFSNQGPLPVSITNITINGGNANQFSQSTNCAPVVPANSGCKIGVLFAPTSVGTKTSTLTVTAAGGSATQTVTVTGVAIAPTYTLDTTALDFGHQPRSVASAARTVTVTNTSPVALPITSITRTGTNASLFSQTNDCGTSVPSGASCTINLVFLPTSAGDKTATLNVNAGASAGSKSVALSGVGIVPTYSTTPGQLDFGNQALNSNSATLIITLTNTGELDLPITALNLNGTNPGQFSQTNSCGASLAAGASCTINVVFRPTTVGAKTANVRLVLGGGATTPALIPLTGSGI